MDQRAALPCLRGSAARRLQSSDTPTPPVVGLYEALPRYPNATTMGVLRGLDLMGTVSFAVSGSVCAASCGLDLVGCTFVGVITALGGGTIRDFLFGKLPVFWLDEREYLYSAIAAALIAFALCCSVELDEFAAYEAVMFWTDTIGLGAFSVIGTMYAIRLGYPPIAVLLCTLITCTGGGLIRDTLCRRPARVLYPFQETYAATTVAGGAAWIAMRKLVVPLAPRVIIAVGTVVGLRCYAAKTHFRMPAADLLLQRQHQDAPQLDPEPVEERSPKLSAEFHPVFTIDAIRSSLAEIGQGAKEDVADGSDDCALIDDESD